MKKIYTTSMMVAILFLALTTTVQAQRTVAVDQGVGTLNEAIFSDTTETGARVDSATVYVLSDGGIYLSTGEIDHSFPLSIVAEDGAAVKPKVYPAVDDGNESARLFVPRDDLTLIGLDISNTDELGARNKNTIRIKGDDAHVYIEDCFLNEDTQAPFRLDADNISVIIKNCIISNMDQDYNNGRVVDDRGNAVDTIWIENSTIYNIGSRLIRDGGELVNYFYFDHNTVVNTGRRVMDVGEVITAVITNNVLRDCGILGQGADDLTAIVGIDSINIDGVTQDVMISHNSYFIDPGYTDLIPDTAVAVPPFNPTATAWVMAKGTALTLHDEDVQFTNGPAPVYTLVSDWYANPATDVTYPDFDKAGEPFDFGYANSTLVGGDSEGGQMGDPRWSATNSVNVEALSYNASGLELFPMPVDDYATIRFTVDTYADVEVSLFSVVGQKVANIVYGSYPSGTHTISWNGADDSGHLLNPGMYILRMNAGGEISTLKIMKN